MSYNEEEYRNQQLERNGFIPWDLTIEQKNIILEPSEAPENYHCDGEISSAVAFTNWKRRLRACGLNAKQIKLAINSNL